MAKAEKTTTRNTLDLEDTVFGNLDMVTATLRLLSESRGYDDQDMGYALAHLANQLGDAREAFAALRAQVRS